MSKLGSIIRFWQGSSDFLNYNLNQVMNYPPTAPSALAHYELNDLESDTSEFAEFMRFGNK